MMRGDCARRSVGSMYTAVETFRNYTFRNYVSFSSLSFKKMVDAQNDPAVY